MDQIIKRIAGQAIFNLEKYGKVVPIALLLKDGEVIKPIMVMNFDSDDEKHGSYMAVGVMARKYLLDGKADQIVFVIEGAMKSYDEEAQKLYEEDPELYAPLTHPESQRQEIIMFYSFDLKAETYCFYTWEFRKKDIVYEFDGLKEIGPIEGNLHDAFNKGFNEIFFELYKG